MDKFSSCGRVVGAEAVNDRIREEEEKWSVANNLIHITTGNFCDADVHRPIITVSWSKSGSFFCKQCAHFHRGVHDVRLTETIQFFPTDYRNKNRKEDVGNSGKFTSTELSEKVSVPIHLFPVHMKCGKAFATKSLFGIHLMVSL